jgi:hypothetical protein
MVEPGTAAIAVLSTIAGVSGYGAMKLNANQARVMDETANRLAAAKIDKVRRELTLATEQMKAQAERELAAKQAEVDQFKRDIEALKSAEAKLQSKLQQATEGERLFSSVSLPGFKKAIRTFQKDPEVVAIVDGLGPPKKKAIEKVFENYTSSARLTLSRGSMQSLFNDLTKAAGQPFMDRAAFDTKITALFRGIDATLEEEKRAKAEPEPKPAEPQPKPAEPEEKEPEERQVTQEEMTRCKETLQSVGIVTKSDYRKWMLKNRDSPRLAEINNCADIVLKQRAGSLRKKKLRTRRGGKQKNVRRTRRS